MLRTGNRRRRERKPRRLGWPAINWLPVVSLLGAVLLAGGGTLAVAWLIDRPITRVVIHGAFERVSADQLEGMLRPQVGRGFLRVDLAGLQREVTALPWIATARLSRRWPDTLELVITEQQPAARWGVEGLLNGRGELFIEQATHVPAGLPRLAGPDGSHVQVAGRFMALQEQMVPRGLAVVALALDERGAWTFELSNGIAVRLGSARVDDRLALFYRALDQVVSAMAGEVEYVDMRYANGFAIGWRQPAQEDGTVRQGVAG